MKPKLYPLWVLTTSGSSDYMAAGKLFVSAPTKASAKKRYEKDRPTASYYGPLSSIERKTGLWAETAHVFFSF